MTSKRLQIGDKKVTLNHLEKSFPIESSKKKMSTEIEIAAKVCKDSHQDPCEVVQKKLMLNMGVSKNSGTPKWMVYNGKRY